MLGFVQNFFAPKGSPIGIDFGSDCLRLAQVQRVAGQAGQPDEYRLVAAASADVPTHVRNDPAARMSFFVETTRDLLSQAEFRSRQAVLALPSAMMFIQHLRMARLDEQETKKALPWELSGKLPIDPAAALLRHIIAGEVYQDQEPKNEVIVMAAARELVDQLLAAAARARLDVVGMNVEPKALLDCFSRVYRRKSDAESTTCYVDVGLSATRALIARGSQILFARSIPIGGEHFSRAAAAALRIPLEEAKLLRIKLCHNQSITDERRTVEAAPIEPAANPPAEEGFALLQAGLMRDRASAATQTAGATAVAEPLTTTAAASPAHPSSQAVEQACAAPLTKLIEELDLCRRYYEATFTGKPVDRLIFVGGEAHQRSLCQTIARQLGLAAQVGDPIARIGRNSEIGIESGIDRRQPQPAWAVAIGLSMGPAQE
jgi:type IV pilus assembly protein PilM